MIQDHRYDGIDKHSFYMSGNDPHLPDRYRVKKGLTADEFEALADYKIARKIDPSIQIPLSVENILKNSKKVVYDHQEPIVSRSTDIEVGFFSGDGGSGSDLM